MGLSRDEIRAVDDIKRVSVAVEEWDGDVPIRALSVRLRQVFVKLYDGVDDPEVPADVWLALNCACTDDGDRLFDDSDLDWLLDKASAALQLIGQKCLELNGLEEGAVEEAEKNSAAIL